MDEEMAEINLMDAQLVWGARSSGIRRGQNLNIELHNIHEEILKEHEVNIKLLQQPERVNRNIVIVGEETEVLVREQAIPKEQRRG